MKVHYSKILLFSLLLNILSHNKKKPYITTHTPTTTSRVLIECNIYIPNYDNDPDINSLRENFHEKTEQRFHEYDKRMIKNRQKRKEKCDKEIQKIILKDNMEKTLAEKVEKGCLMCGCGLGGVAVGVGLLGTAVVNELKRAALAAAIDAAIVKSAAEGAAKGAAKGAAEVVSGLKSWGMDKLGLGPLENFIHATNYRSEDLISQFIYSQYRMKCGLVRSGSGAYEEFCTSVIRNGLIEGTGHGYDITTPSSIKIAAETMVSDATRVAEAVSETFTEEVTAGAIKTNAAAIDVTYASYQTAIIASVVAILIILLIMIIIYLILRYRRKKKKTKKQQYTKLLN
ncbi:PIR protein, putative [Plasmodium sp.]|nr:PIR protein, putative [Plasmodium sp.]